MRSSAHSIPGPARKSGRAKMNDVARTVPITYQGKDGKQYVAVMAAGAGGPLVAANAPPGTGRLYVWSLQ